MCMHHINTMCHEQGRQLLHFLFLNYLPLSLLHIVNGVRAQGEITQKPKVQKLSSLFMIHCLIVMYAPVKFHEYIPYSLGVMARTPFTICN